MTVNECIRERRSVRRFKEIPVSHELLTEVVEAASFAPSWKNTQITRYIAVEGALKDKIASECTQAYPRNGEIMANAPVLIAVTYMKGRCGFERDGSYSTPKGESWQMFDAGVASQTFCLSAYEKGLGSVIMGIFDEAKAAALLNIPDTQELVALIPVGYPDETPVAPKRKSAQELLLFEN